LRVQDIDFAGMVAISAGDEFLRPRPKKASEGSPGAFPQLSLGPRRASNERVPYNKLVGTMSV